MPEMQDPLTLIQSRWAAVQKAHAGVTAALRALREARAELREATAELDRCLAEMQQGAHPLYDQAEQPPHAAVEADLDRVQKALDAPAPPRCHRCGSTGGSEVDMPSQADADDDLIPCDMVDMDEVLTPMGLTDQVAENYWICAKCHNFLIEPPAPPRPKRARKPKLPALPPEQARVIHDSLCPNGPGKPLPPEPLTRATPLNVVLPMSVENRPKVLEALYAANLRTVADLLDQAARVDPGYREGKPYRSDCQRVAHVLRGAAAPLTLYDALIDGGLFSLFPLPDLSASAPLPVPPLKVPASEVGSEVGKAPAPSLRKGDPVRLKGDGSEVWQILSVKKGVARIEALSRPGHVCESPLAKLEHASTGQRLSLAIGDRVRKVGDDDREGTVTALKAKSNEIFIEWDKRPGERKQGRGWFEASKLHALEQPRPSATGEPDPLLDTPRSVCCGCGQAGDILDATMAVVTDDDDLRRLALKEDDLLPVAALAEELRDQAGRHFGCDPETDHLCGECLENPRWRTGEPESMGKAKGAKA